MPGLFEMTCAKCMLNVDVDASGKSSDRNGQNRLKTLSPDIGWGWGGGTDSHLVSFQW